MGSDGPKVTCFSVAVTSNQNESAVTCGGADFVITMEVFLI